MAKGKIGQGALKAAGLHGFRELGNALYPGSPVVEQNPGGFLNPTPHEINQDREAPAEQSESILERKLGTLDSRDSRVEPSVARDHVDRDGPELEEP